MVPDFPHHVTDKGNRGCDVFLGDSDRDRYLELLQNYSEKNGLEISAYCLMDNHVHIVAVPRRMDALAKTIGPVHMRHAQWMNKINGWRGHLWSDRFFSTPMDHDHFIAAVRYVESNPVRAGIVSVAEEYPWSSAQSHVSGISDPLLSENALFGLDKEIEDWSSWLAEVGHQKKIERLKQSTRSGYPCGSDGFIQFLSKCTGRDFNRRPRGRKCRQTS